MISLYLWFAASIRYDLDHNQPKSKWDVLVYLTRLRRTLYTLSPRTSTMLCRIPLITAFTSLLLLYCFEGNVGQLFTNYILVLKMWILEH